MVLFKLIFAFPFVTVATVVCAGVFVLSPTVTSLKFNSLAAVLNSKPVFPLRLIVSALPPAMPLIFTVPFVVPKFAVTL